MMEFLCDLFIHSYIHVYCNTFNSLRNVFGSLYQPPAQPVQEETMDGDMPVKPFLKKLSPLFFLGLTMYFYFNPLFSRLFSPQHMSASTGIPQFGSLSAHTFGSPFKAPDAQQQQQQQQQQLQMQQLQQQLHQQFDQEFHLDQQQQQQQQQQQPGDDSW